MTDARTSHWQVWVPFVSALVGVALGGFISNATAERQIDVAQEAEQREIRAEVYLTFLSAADDYANATREVLLAHDIRGPVPADVISTLRSDPQVGPWLTARFNFQNALNRVSIYGSDDGWSTARALAGALPASLGTGYEFVEVDASLNSQYRDLLTVVCDTVDWGPQSAQVPR